MDKRIIWFALIIIIAVGAIFYFRKSPPPIPTNARLIPQFSIDEKDIKIGDSVYYEDNTPGAKSWLWDFGDGTTSQSPNGHNKYFEKGEYYVKLTINGETTDSIYLVVNPIGDPPIPTRVMVTGPKTALVGQVVTYTDMTPGAKQTNWRNMATSEIKRNSKTYTTSFSQKGTFDIIATNEINTKGSNNQGIVTVTVRSSVPPPPPPPPPPVKCAVCGGSHATKDHPPKPVKCEICGSTAHATKDHPVPPPPPKKQNPSNEQLKAWLTIIAAGKGNFLDNYKPLKNAIADNSLEVEVNRKGSKSTFPLGTFCKNLTFTNPKIVNVTSDWNEIEGFKKLKVLLED